MRDCADVATAAGLTLLLVATSAPPVTASPAEEAGQPVGSTRLVSHSVDGRPPRTGDSGGPSVSDNGRFVAFFSRAHDIEAGSPCSLLFGCILLEDRVIGETLLVSKSPTGEGPDSYVGSATISGDGRYIAYAANARNLVPDDANGTYDVFVYDRLTDSTLLISRNPDGRSANGLSLSPRLSFDGRYVFYGSTATDLVPGDNNGDAADIFRFDRATGTTTVLSLTRHGERPKRGIASGPDIDADGRFVAYASRSRDIVLGDTNHATDMFLLDSATGKTRLISRTPDGRPGDGDSTGPEMSGEAAQSCYVSCQRPWAA